MSAYVEDLLRSTMRPFPTPKQYLAPDDLNRNATGDGFEFKRMLLQVQLNAMTGYPILNRAGAVDFTGNLTRNYTLKELWYEAQGNATLIRAAVAHIRKFRPRWGWGMIASDTRTTTPVDVGGGEGEGNGTAAGWGGEGAAGWGDGAAAGEGAGSYGQPQASSPPPASAGEGDGYGQPQAGYAQPQAQPPPAASAGEGDGYAQPQAQPPPAASAGEGDGYAQPQAGYAQPQAAAATPRMLSGAFAALQQQAENSDHPPSNVWDHAPEVPLDEVDIHPVGWRDLLRRLDDPFDKSLDPTFRSEFQQARRLRHHDTQKQWTNDNRYPSTTLDPAWVPGPTVDPHAYLLELDNAFEAKLGNPLLPSVEDYRQFLFDALMESPEDGYLYLDFCGWMKRWLGRKRADKNFSEWSVPSSYRGVTKQLQSSSKSVLN